MAGYRTHIGMALLFCGGLYLFPFWQELTFEGKIACILTAVFFGLFPDVDTKSRGQYYFLVLFLVVNSILIYREEYKRSAYLGMLVVLPMMSRHRGWTHSYLAMILIPGGCYLAAINYTSGSAYDWLPYFMAALLGYASHLVTDKF